MKWAKVRQIIRKLGVLLGLGIFVYLITSNFRELNSLPIRVSFNFSFAFLTLLLYVLVYFLQIINLKLIYLSLDQEIKLQDVISGFSLALLPKYIPGYIWGYLSRSDWFEREKNVSLNDSWSAAIIEIVVTISTGLTAIGSFFLYREGEYIFLVICLILIPNVEFGLIKLIDTILLKKLIKKNLSFNRVLLKHWLIIFSNSLLQWAILGLAILALIAACLPDGTYSLQSFWVNIYIFARSWLSGFLVFIIPNGMGVRELIFTDLLIVELRIHSELALLISTLSRLLLLTVEGLWVLVAVAITRKKEA